MYIMGCTYSIPLNNSLYQKPPVKKKIPYYKRNNKLTINTQV